MKYLAIIPLIIMSSFTALHHFYLVPMMVASEETEEAEALELLKGPFSETAEQVMRLRYFERGDVEIYIDEDRSDILFVDPYKMSIALESWLSSKEQDVAEPVHGYLVDILEQKNCPIVFLSEEYVSFDRYHDLMGEFDPERDDNKIFDYMIPLKSCASHKTDLGTYHLTLTSNKLVERLSQSPSELNLTLLGEDSWYGVTVSKPSRTYLMDFMTEDKDDFCMFWEVIKSYPNSRQIQQTMYPLRSKGLTLCDQFDTATIASLESVHGELADSKDKLVQHYENRYAIPEECLHFIPNQNQNFLQVFLRDLDDCQVMEKKIYYLDDYLLKGGYIFNYSEGEHILPISPQDLKWEIKQAKKSVGMQTKGFGAAGHILQFAVAKEDCEEVASFFHLSTLDFMDIRENHGAAMLNDLINGLSQGEANFISSSPFTQLANSFTAHNLTFYNLFGRELGTGGPDVIRFFVPWINPDFAKDYGEVISFKLAIDDPLYPFMDMPYESFSIDGFYEKLEEIKSICRKL